MVWLYNGWVKVDELKQSKLFSFLGHSMQDLVVESVELLELFERKKQKKFHDYSFILFPVMKAYEGFLKKYLLEERLITKDAVESRHFRIGRSLSPDLPDFLKDEKWVYDDLDEMCKRMGKGDLAERVWEAWTENRNKLFHFFPEHVNFVSLEETRDRLDEVLRVMEELVE